MFERPKKKRDINFKYNLKVYWDIIKDYKVLLIFTLITALLIESSVIIESFIFKEIIDRGTSYSNSLISSEVFISFLLICLIIYIILIISQAIFRWLSIHYLNVLDVNSILDLKQKFFNHLITLSHRFHQTHSTGMLISRLNRGVNAIEQMNDFIAFNTLPLFFQLILASISLAYFDWASSLILVLTVITFITYSFFIQNSQQEPNLKLNAQEDIEKSTINDIFSNIDTIKYTIMKVGLIGGIVNIINISSSSFENFLINDIYRSYHPVEIHRCGVYTTRMFNYDVDNVKQSQDFRIEIWKHTYDDKVAKL